MSLPEEAATPRIAVVDDEPIVRREIARGLSKERFRIESFADGESALRRLAQVDFDLVISDMRLPGMSGMDVLKAVLTRSPHTEVIIITAFSSVDAAIDAIRAGAFHYVVKPVKMAELKTLVDRALDKVMLVRDRERLRQALLSRSRSPSMIGTSKAMQEVYALIEKVAPLDCTVLIQGESGTGKEMVARSLHEGGPRRDRPFVTFNCGGFAEELITNELFGHERGAFTGATTTKAGLLETAHSGSILLDEISEMPQTMQVKLLRFAQERSLMRVGGVKPIPVDVRLVAASNRDLAQLVEEGSFREDLYYRFNVVVITVPPLRERMDDLPLLASHFVAKHAQAFGKQVEGVSPRALHLLSQYAFPGNVRELENLVERAVALTDEERITHRDLPPQIRNLGQSGEEQDTLSTLEEHEAEYIRKVLRLTGHKRNRAADILGIPRTTLWRKMKRHGLD